MNILDIIEKKKNNEVLTKDEIDYAFNGYLKAGIKDYQMSALLMAITINGMNLRETIDLTDIMLNSGVKLDVSKVKGIQVDKHSTGGIGDKTSLVIGSIMASLGLKMGKLSGRGLGITGGTIDKLESIPGFRVNLEKDEFLFYMNKVGFVECEQTDEFTPLDKVIYSLRSASGSVSSIPLIASSIMSKKLAVGAKYILIDIKVGEGGLIKNKKDAVELANTMIEIGKVYNVVVIPVLTDMDIPLGDNIGNALEILEVLDVLKGKTGALRDLVIELSSLLYSKAMQRDMGVARKKVIEVLDNGRAYSKFLEFVRAQDGDITKIVLAKNQIPVKSEVSGTLQSISAKIIGEISLELGGGRKNKDDEISYGTGIVINKHIGDKIKIGEPLIYLYCNDVPPRELRNKSLDAFKIVK